MRPRGKGGVKYLAYVSVPTLWTATTRKECKTKKEQNEMSATQKKCNMKKGATRKKVQDEKSAR